MKKIASFTVDHLRLLRGVYLSRQDMVGTEVVTTFDIRMKEPNREAAMTPAVAHTIEHLAATYLRNDHEWGERIVYWGPMGCLTGHYLIVKGDLSPRDILPVVKRTFEFIATYEGEIPGATPRDCGNYSMMDLAGTHTEAKKFVSLLENVKEENLVYP